MIGRLIAAGRILLLGEEKDPEPVNGARMWGAVPNESPFDDELRASQRNSAALSMCDDEVIGYVLLTARREFHGPHAEVRVLSEVPRDLWPAFSETMRRLVRAAREVHAD